MDHTTITILNRILNDKQIQQRIEEIEGPVVYATTRTTEDYHHKRNCWHIKRKENVVHVQRRLLDDLGYKACTDCKPE